MFAGFRFWSLCDTFTSTPAPIQLSVQCTGKRPIAMLNRSRQADGIPHIVTCRSLLYEWSQKWQMEFNVEKCHVMKFGKSGMRPDWKYKLGNDSLQV